MENAPTRSSTIGAGQGPAAPITPPAGWGRAPHRVTLGLFSPAVPHHQRPARPQTLLSPAPSSNRKAGLPPPGTHPGPRQLPRKPWRSSPAPSAAELGPTAQAAHSRQRRGGRPPPRGMNNFLSRLLPCHSHEVGARLGDAIAVTKLPTLTTQRRWGLPDALSHSASVFLTSAVLTGRCSWFAAGLQSPFPRPAPRRQPRAAAELLTWQPRPLSSRLESCQNKH